MQWRGGVIVWLFRRPVFRCFAVDHVGYQHRMVGGQGPAGFADQVRVGNAVAITLRLQNMHHVIGVFVNAVVHGAAAAGAGALVVHTQAAADIHRAHRSAHLAQFTVEAGTFPETGLDVTDVGNLGAKMEVQKLQGVQGTRLAQGVDDIQDLAGRQSEFRLFTTCVLPVAFADGGQPGPNSDQR